MADENPQDDPKTVRVNSPKKPDGRLVRGAARRTQIIETAVEVFSEQGYKSGSLREISRRVGISEAGVLHHFGSKDGLLEAVLDYRDSTEAQRTEHLDAHGTKFVAAIRDLVARNAQSPGLVALHVLLSAEASDPAHPAHEFFVRRYRGLRHQDDTRFSDLQQAGVINPNIDPHSLGQLVTAIMDGLQLQWALDPDNVDMPALFDQFLVLLGGPALIETASPEHGSPSEGNASA